MAFPFFHQMDEMDCGPTCLNIVAASHGKQFPMENLRKLCYKSRTGVSLLSLSDAAESIGMHSTGVHRALEPEPLHRRL